MIDVVKIAKALSDPIRYEILKFLVRRDAEPGAELVSNCCSGLCNCDIMQVFGLIQSRVSYHMRELVDAQLVIEEQRGKWKYYYPNYQILKDYVKQIEANFLQR